MKTEKNLLTTPWLSVVEKTLAPQAEPYYVIDCPDFAVVVATDPQGRLLLVRQFRPAVEETTLELPAGHVDPGDSPEKTARKELLEETGYVAGEMEFLASLSPSTARFRSRMWCYWAPKAQLAPDADAQREKGMNLVVYDRGWKALIDEPDFYAAGSHAALLMAIARGKLTV